MSQMLLVALAVELIAAFRGLKRPVGVFLGVIARELIIPKENGLGVQPGAG